MAADFYGNRTADLSRARITKEQADASAKVLAGKAADVELLPLPEPEIEERGTGMGAHDVYYVPRWYTPEQMETYARANVARAIAAKDAEIEALREQLDWMVQQNDDLLNEGRELTARAERLAEALRDAMGYINSMNYPVAIAKIDALLRDQEEGK